MIGSKAVDEKRHRPGGASISGARGSRIVARLYLILLAAIWFMVVYVFLQMVGADYQDDISSDLPMWEDLGLALLMASPLLLGAIALSGRGFVARAVRVLSAMALAVIVVFGVNSMTFETISSLAGNEPKNLVYIVASLAFAELPMLLLIASIILAAEEVKALVAYFRAKGRKGAGSCTASK